MSILEELEGLEEEDVISDLRKETLPLVMWGAGSSAPEVNYYLKKHGIIITDVFVDDDYYTENLLFNKKAVLSYSMLKEKYNKVNVILGNSYYEKKEILDKRLRLYKAIYKLPNGTDIKKIKGCDLYRLRVGDCRVLYTVDEAIRLIDIENIDNRGDVYKRI